MVCMIVVLLLLFSPAVSQPVDGPHLLFESPYGTIFRTPRLAMLNTDEAGLFFGQRQDSLEAVYKVQISTAAWQLISQPLFLYSETDWTHELVDAEARDDGDWALIHESWQGTSSRARVFWGNGPEVHLEIIATGFISDELGDSRYGFFTLFPNPSGGWITGLMYARTFPPFFEGYSTPLLTFISGSTIVNRLEVYDGSALGSNWVGMKNFSTAAAPDIVWTLLHYWDFEDSQQPEHWGLKLSTINDETAYLDSIDASLVPLECSFNHIGYGIDFEFKRTNGGRFIVFTPSEIVEVDTSGTCTFLGENDLPREPDATAWHPDYGFASLLVHHGRLMVSRVDTNGVIVQPLGVICDAPDSLRIVHGDLEVTDDGRVVVVWTEYRDFTEGPTIIKAAAVPWGQFLETEPISRTPLPQSLSLSAYPNPFNSTVLIEYTLSRSADVDLSVYNITGRKTAVLRSGQQEAGSHSAQWTPNASTGIYLVRLTTPAQSRTVKLVYLR